MGNPKDKDREFIVGVSQGDYVGELKIEDFRDNFVYQQYLESRNWQEYIDDKNIDESIDREIRNSKYRPIYESIEKIKFEDAINIYFLIKESIKRNNLLDSNIFIFVRIMDILRINVNLAFAYVPLDEKLKFNEELESKNLILLKNKNKNIQLF